MEIIAFILLTLSTIVLAVIPITFDKRIEGWEEIIIKFKNHIKEFRRFRQISSNALENYDQINLINQIYESVTPKERRIDFIQDNIRERLRAALRFTATWDAKFDEQALQTNRMSTDLLFKNIFYYQEGMQKTLTGLLNDCSEAEKRQEKVKKYKQWIIVTCVVMNSGSLLFGFLSTYYSNARVDQQQKQLMEAVKRIENAVLKK